MRRDFFAAARVSDTIRVTVVHEILKSTLRTEPIGGEPRTEGEHNRVKSTGSRMDSLQSPR